MFFCKAFFSSSFLIITECFCYVLYNCWIHLWFTVCTIDHHRSLFPHFWFRIKLRHCIWTRILFFQSQHFSFWKSKLWGFFFFSLWLERKYPFWDCSLLRCKYFHFKPKIKFNISFTPQHSTTHWYKWTTTIQVNFTEASSLLHCCWML